MSKVWFVFIIASIGLNSCKTCYECEGPEITCGTCTVLGIEGPVECTTEGQDIDDFTAVCASLGGFVTITSTTSAGSSEVCDKDDKVVDAEVERLEDLGYTCNEK